MSLWLNPGRTSSYFVVVCCTRCGSYSGCDVDSSLCCGEGRIESERNCSNPDRAQRPRVWIEARSSYPYFVVVCCTGPGLMFEPRHHSPVDCISSLSTHQNHHHHHHHHRSRWLTWTFFFMCISSSCSVLAHVFFLFNFIRSFVFVVSNCSSSSCWSC